MDPNLESARSTANTAASKYSSESAAGASLPDMLRDALNKKFSTNNPLVQNRESALTRYMGAQTEAPLKYTAQSAGGQAPVVYNPEQQANLIQQYRAPALSALTTANELYGLGTGGIGNVVDSVSRAHAGALEGMKAEAGGAQQNFENLLAEMKLEEDKRQADMQYKLGSQKAGSGTDTFSEIERAIEEARRGRSPSSRKPSGLPTPLSQPDASGRGANIDPNNEYLSDDGQWVWSYQGGWQPY